MPTQSLEEFLADLEENEPGRLMWWLRYGPRHLMRRMRWYAGEPRRMWQRARRGYSYADVWSFDHYLSGVIVGGLRDLKEGHGYPNELASMDEWKAILDEMIEGFEVAREADLLIDEEKKAKVDRALSLFSYWYFGLWD